MQRIWATIATVWAVLGVTAALAWAQTSHVATTPTPDRGDGDDLGCGLHGGGRFEERDRSAPAHATTHTS